ARTRAIAALQVAARRAPLVAAALVQRGQELELLVAQRRELGLEPLRGREIIALELAAFRRSRDQLALEVVLEHDLDVAGNARVLALEDEQVVAVGEDRDQVADATA